LVHSRSAFFVVGRPDLRGREAILKVHTKKVPLSDEVDLSKVARGTPGFAGADLANLVNEAALVAARQNRKVVMQIDFEVAKDKVIMGVERKSMLVSDEEKKNTAYHEAGHALVAAVLPDADPLHKVTIIPRGMALGVTMQLPLDDKHSYNREYLNAQLAILMAGRIAEEMFMHHMTTGAGNDIERATDLARRMTCEWGMSELGPLAFGKKEEQIKEADVPEVVLNAFKTAHPDVTIIEIEKETYKDGTIHYGFEFKDKDGKKHEAEYTADGESNEG